jgi:hypothetical protein
MRPRANVVATLLIVAAAIVTSWHDRRLSYPLFWIGLAVVAGGPILLTRWAWAYRTTSVASALVIFFIGGLGALNGGTLLWPAAVASLVAVGQRRQDA